MKNNKLITTAILSLPLISLTGVCADKKNTEKPNIIFILADDMGYSGITPFGGHGLSTPALNRLAQDGVICTNFHSNAPVSSPTRAAFMTGSYQQRVGLNHIYSETDPLDGLDPEVNPAFATMLQGNGYHTGIMGKWHLGQDIKFNPLNHGFDTWHGYTMGNIDFISHYNTQKQIDWWYNKELKDEPGYVTDLINKYAVEFIRDTKEGQPFFLVVSHDAIHVPMQGRNDPPLRDGVNNPYRHDDKMTDEEYQRVYREMIQIVDEGVAMIIAELERKGILENTLIVFTSDNGGEQIASQKYPGANGYFRGSKASLYEGGIRVPAIFYYPKAMEHKTVDDMMLTMDLMPTFLELAGIKNTRTIDGVSLLPTLTENKPMPKRNVFWANIGYAAVADENWKLVVQRDKKELFNMMIDPKEEHDLSAIYPEMVETLSASIDTWWKEVTNGNKLEGKTPFDRNVMAPPPSGQTPQGAQQQVRQQ